MSKKIISAIIISISLISCLTIIFTGNKYAHSNPFDSVQPKILNNLIRRISNPHTCSLTLDYKGRLYLKYGDKEFTEGQSIENIKLEELNLTNQKSINNYFMGQLNFIITAIDNNKKYSFRAPIFWTSRPKFHCITDLSLFD